MLPRTVEVRSKSRAVVRCGLRPDSPAVALNDSPADGKSEAGAGVFVFMQAFEEPKDSFGILGLEPDAVIFYGDNPACAVTIGSDLDLRPGAVLLIFNGVRQEVLKNMRKLCCVSADRRK